MEGPRGRVGGRVERALGGRAFAEDAEDDGAVAELLVRQRQPAGERQVPADDGVAAHEEALRVEEVHGAALASTHARLLAEEFGHHATGGEPAGGGGAAA